MLVDKIISLANFEQAYLEIVGSFISDHKNRRYHGLDGHFLCDHDLTSQQLLISCQKELLTGQPISPAISIKIPKRNKPDSYREVFVYNIRERIKAQAIYRIILPTLDNYFSERLFSYRPGRPPYLAAKQFCHNYRRNFSSSQALVIDLKNYSEQINQGILINQLENFFNDKSLLNLLKLFIGNSICRQGVIGQLDQGLVQGVPLIALFANLYLTEIDLKYKRLANFYVRVGDDIAFLDNNYQRLSSTKDQLFTDLTALELVFNKNKIYLGPAAGDFNFLGYKLANGKISLEPALVERILANWRQILTRQHWSYGLKYKLLKKQMASLATNYNYQFGRLLAAKPQINDYQQMRYLAEKFFIIMTKFLYRSYTPRQRRLAAEQLRQLGIESPYQIYWRFHHGKS